jgi:hypothetical protein
MVVLALVGTAGAGWVKLEGGDSLYTKVEVLYTGSDSTVIDITVPGCETLVVTVDSVEYTRLVVPSAVNCLLEEGRPEVPILPLTVAVPTGAEKGTQYLTPGAVGTLGRWAAQRDVGEDRTPAFTLHLFWEGL